jgi:hypothetical protein
MSDEGKTIEEVKEEYNKFHGIPLDVTDSIIHEEFVAGVANKTAGFKVRGGEPITLVRGARKAIFNILAALYQIAPLLIIPFWAYHESNWWLLIGIPVASFIAPQLFALRQRYSSGGLLLLVFVIFWVIKGIHNYFTFFLLCAMWGCFFFQVADGAQNHYAMESLIENPELFNKAIADKRIVIVRRR